MDEVLKRLSNSRKNLYDIICATGSIKENISGTLRDLAYVSEHFRKNKMYNLELICLRSSQEVACCLYSIQYDPRRSIRGIEQILLILSRKANDENDKNPEYSQEQEGEEDATV